MAARHSAFPRFDRGRGEGAEARSRPLDFSGHEVVARLHMRLKPGPEAAGEGRHALDRLEGTLPGDQLNELRLLVTELLTNSVRHGARAANWIALDVDVYANAVRVVVTDPGPGFQLKRPPRPHPDRPGGWGLCLVDHLADRWGVDSGDETAVWVELDRRGAGFATAA
jgi:anti-sigma regulatory factor (Ser/Thr protein kinase)